MSREEVFFNAITNIREELVEEAQGYVFRKRRAVWRRYAGAAACLTLAAAVCFGAYRISNIRLGGSDANGAAPASGDSSANQYTGSADNPPLEPEAPGADGQADAGADVTGPADDAPVAICGFVLEVHETYLLVSEAEEIKVPTAGLEDLPEFREGDTVMFTCRELVRQDGETAASGVIGIWLVEP